MFIMLSDYECIKRVFMGMCDCDCIKNVICRLFLDDLRTHTLALILFHMHGSRYTVLEDIITENKL